MGPRDPDGFRKLVKRMGLEQYLEHPLFQNLPSDVLGKEGRGAIHVQAQPIWEESLKTWKSEDLLDLFHSLGSHGGQVNTFSELFAHPQMAALDMVREIEAPGVGKVMCVISPWMMEGVPKAKPLPYNERP